jgi:hypothetical protein
LRLRLNRVKCVVTENSRWLLDFERFARDAAGVMVFPSATRWRAYLDFSHMVKSYFTSTAFFFRWHFDLSIPIHCNPFHPFK